MNRKSSIANTAGMAAYIVVTLFAGITGAQARETALAPSDAIKSAAAPQTAGLGTPVVQALPSAPLIEPQNQPQNAFVAPAPAPEALTQPSGKARSLAELVASYTAQGPLSDEMRCLAGAIYFEARGEPLVGQLAVGEVIKNRAGSGRFPSSYCGVVFQRAQFSFVRGGRMPAINENSQAWRNAQAVAQIADADLWESPADDALYFHARHVNPRWNHKRIAQISTHIFYR